MTRYGYTYQPDTCPEHSFGSNDGRPVDDHCSRCGILWSEREREARAATPCPCGSGLPRYEGACPACYPRASVQAARAYPPQPTHCSVCNGPLPKFGSCRLGPPMCDACQRDARARARTARVISGTGNTSEQHELAALVRGLRAND